MFAPSLPAPVADVPQLDLPALTIAWKPMWGSQADALMSPAHVTLYHGTRGPGKTDTQLMRFRRHVGRGFGRHWRGVIFDREYKNLDDLVSKSLRWFPLFEDGARFLSSKSDYRWAWPTGEELLFRAVKRPSDYWAYHGQEFPFIGWNELTKYPDDELFEMMMSCNRSSYRPEDFPIVDNDTGEVSYTDELPLEVFATTNPYGPGHYWVKKRFITAAKEGELFKKAINVFNPRTGRREIVVKTQVHIYGSYRENKYLSPEYIADLEVMTDRNKRRAWLGGSWDIVAGGMFDDVWDSLYNVVAPFAIPPSWRMQRAFDWGSAHPFSVGWYAISDGSDVQMADGSWRSTVRGDVFRVGEWYGTNGKANQGLRMLATEVAEGIIERELKAGWYGRVKPGPADNQIWDLVNGTCLAVDMAKNVKIKGRAYSGVTWLRSDKSSGSRKTGWERLRQYLKAAWPAFVPGRDGKPVRVPRERPGLFVFNTCKHTLDLFPILPRDEKDLDDVDTTAEDHIGDEMRYMLLSLVTGVRGGRSKGTT